MLAFNKDEKKIWAVVPLSWLLCLYFDGGKMGIESSLLTLFLFLISYSTDHVVSKYIDIYRPSV